MSDVSGAGVTKCPKCITEKAERNKHCKCEVCGHYRPLKGKELAKVAKRA